MNKRIGKSLENIVLKNNGFILGEDIAGEYGGAFKVTKDLSVKYEEQVLNMPISEAAIIGYAAGLSTSNLPVTAEIMFGDFLGLAADQIINHVAKFGVMHSTFTPKLIIRTPIGGGRGYGPTHSQNLEKIFGGLPGIKLYHLSFLHNVQLAFEGAAIQSGCTIISEPKLQYGLSFANLPDDFESLFKISSVLQNKEQEILFISSDVMPSELSIICTGIALPHVLKAAKRLLLEFEVPVDIICPRTVYPLVGQTIINDLVKPQCIIVDEAHDGYGFSDYIVSRMHRKTNCKIVGLQYPFYPSATQLEDQMLISDELIIKQIREIL
ncbi:hypothetical protein N9466_06375 [Amylibacter sp.]|nr:hypothetical protein [Amylibacter sp.]